MESFYEGGTCQSEPPGRMRPFGGWADRCSSPRCERQLVTSVLKRSSWVNGAIIKILILVATITINSNLIMLSRLGFRMSRLAARRSVQHGVARRFVTNQTHFEDLATLEHQMKVKMVEGEPSVE